MLDEKPVILGKKPDTDGVESVGRKDKFCMSTSQHTNLTMKPTQLQFAAYQRIFDYFNLALFDDCLPECMLTFSRRKCGTRALFSPERWRQQAGSITPEVSLNIRQLGEGTSKTVMATLVRQMVHLWQERHGSPSRNGYFNREWAKKMEEIGLIPSHTGEPGGLRTGQGIMHYIEEGGRFETAFEKMPADYLWPFLPKIPASEKYTLKVMYRCIGCGTRVWGKGGLGLICECGQVLVDATETVKAGLREKVYCILAKQCAAKENNSRKEAV